MPVLIVANDPKAWPISIPNVEVIDARTYLTRPEYSEMRGVKLFNMCRSYRYQSSGYYVSLLAEARGHKPLPSITTIQDMKSQAIIRLVSDDLDEMIQKGLAPIQRDKFTLSIYFGRNMARRYDRLCLHLFNLFQSPMLRAHFAKNGKWVLRSVATISAAEVPQSHWPFVVQVASEHFAGRGARVRRRAQARYDLAILVNPSEKDAPSDEKALKKFVKAAESLGMEAEFIGKDDYGRIAEFDALFIRETTLVNHHTYRFARRAASEGLVVIDDPQSIVRCSNKVYLAESLALKDVPTPKTMVVHKGNVDTVADELGLPCVLKKPDSAFSLGVVKVDTREELAERLKAMLEDSDLIVAQEFVPTTFDWRIGILAGRPLYACKYFMAPKHWQIIKRDGSGGSEFGKFETMPVEVAPAKAVRAALRAANLIGDGLYGVDVKQSNDKFYVIEVNDNPNMDAGVEDAVIKDELYRRVMEVFLQRIEQRKAGVRSA
ncbi:MAG: RimK family alpha-L-glutamate ligase [Planctomycetota bacterium]|nr:MAG: RimK family alpha-L-glutamate ligase [Planctomycetota bacterium]